MPKRSWPPTRINLLAALNAVVAGCGPAPAGPPLEDCDYGLFEADCGGEGGDAFGCESVLGECRWFRGGVVAAGYASSRCGAANLCCEGAPPGSPFAGWALPTEAAVRRARRDLGVIRLAAPALGRRDVAVVIGDVTPPTTPRASCVGSVPSSFCGPPVGIDRANVGHSLVITVLSLGDPTQVIIEVEPTPTGHTASLWWAQGDLMDVRPTANCASIRGNGALPGSGTLTLAAGSFDDPTNAHGVLDVTLSAIDGTLYGDLLVEF